VRPSLLSDIDCALVAQILLSDIEEGECWGLELLHIFAIEARINHGNLFCYLITHIRGSASLSGKDQLLRSSLVYGRVDGIPNLS
jgi:hypothetical protein